MSSTYLSLHYHLVFGTNNRVPSIDIPWRSGLHEYMGGTVRDAVRKYISNQEEYHRLKSFREEFVELLEKAGVEYAPRYLD